MSTFSCFLLRRPVEGLKNVIFSIDRIEGETVFFQADADDVATAEQPGLVIEGIEDHSDDEGEAFIAACHIDASLVHLMDETVAESVVRCIDADERLLRYAR